MAARLMDARYASTCANCGKPIAQGAPIFYDKAAPRGRKAWHQSCSAAAEQPAAPVAAAPAVRAIDPGILMEFDSTHAYIEFARGPIHNDRNRAVRDRYLCRESRGADWLGLPSREETMRAIDQGWADGARTVLELAATIDVPAPVDTRRRRVRADQGDALDIHAVYRGNLSTAWERTRRLSTRAPLPVTLVASMQAGAIIEARTYFWRGAACLALADALAQAGYSVTIVAEYVGQIADNGGPDFIHRITVKESTAPIDVSQLAPVLCLAGMKRLFGFASGLRHLALRRITNGSTESVDWRSLNAEARAAREVAGFDAFDNGPDEQLREAARERIVAALAQITGADALAEAA